MSNIALQIEKTTDGSVADNAPVIFNNTILTNGNITYDAVTGIVTINENGRYQAEWWVAQQSSSAVSSAFGLSGGEIGNILGVSPQKTGQTSGVAVFEIADAPATLSLSNLSGAEAYLSSTAAVKASLVIVQDDEASVGDGGSIIPFASGLVPVQLTSIIGGLVGLPSYVAFGNSVQDVSVLGENMNLASLANMAFSVPRDGTITSIAAYFNLTVAVDILLSEVTVRAELYQSTTPDNIFTPVAGSQIDLSPALTGALAIGALANGMIDGLSIPVTAQTRLLMVFSITTTGVNLVQTITGNASAGVNIV